jgi:hypothetical protein
VTINEEGSPMTDTTFEGWVILELMGHRRLAGYIQEATIAGGSFVRIDVPGEPGPTGQEYIASQFYAPGAIYCITPTTEETARAVAFNNRPTPVQRWELEPAPVYGGITDDPDDPDDPDEVRGGDSDGEF